MDEKNVEQNKKEIENLCSYILMECNLDKYRYEAVTDLVEIYSRLGETEKALDALRKAFEHEKTIDGCMNEAVEHTSVLLRGYPFDMRNLYDGCKCNGVWCFLKC